MASTLKSGKTHRKTYILIVTGVLVVILCIAPIFLQGLRHPLRLFFPGTFKPPSPDLTKCTRIEIQLEPRWFFNNSGLLNDKENRQRRSSLKSIMLVDPNDIKTLANVVASAKYKMDSTNPIDVTEYNQITGYVDSKPRVSFIIRGYELWLKYDSFFRIFYNPKFRSYFSKIASEKLPFQKRIYCGAVKLENLRRELIKAIQGKNKYPTAAEWCDAMEQYWQSKPDYPARESGLKWVFKCPEQREGRCHYAMNPKIQRAAVSS